MKGFQETCFLRLGLRYWQRITIIVLHNPFPTIESGEQTAVN